VYLTARDEPDHDQAVENDELVAALEKRTRSLADDERVDNDVYPNNAFGI
jgi:hypothetical protein